MLNMHKGELILSTEGEKVRERAGEMAHRLRASTAAAVHLVTSTHTRGLQQPVTPDPDSQCLWPWSPWSPIHIILK